MDRVAVFVDAGYLFAQGSALLTGQKRPRGELTLDTPAVIAKLEALATTVSGLPVLRTYWYDGTSIGPTAQHLALAHMPGVKVRLGFVNRAGEQKGVDSLIVTDMINLARNRAMAEAVLLSGDEDLRVGVQQGQEFGVKIHLLGIEPSRGSQSLFLLQEADSTHEWHASDVVAFLTHTPRAPTAAGPATTPPTSAPAAAAVAPQAAVPAGAGHSLAAIAIEVAASVDVSTLEPLIAGFRSTAQIPREFDARLLAKAGRAISAQLDPRQKRELRTMFIAECEKRITGA